MKTLITTNVYRLSDISRTCRNALFIMGIVSVVTALCIFASICLWLGYSAPAYLALVYLLGFSHFSSAIGVMTVPLMALIAFRRFRNEIIEEYNLVIQEGQFKALWYDKQGLGFLSPGKYALTRVGMRFWNDAEPELINVLDEMKVLPAHFKSLLTTGFESLSSYYWSKFICFLHSMIVDYQAIFPALVSYTGLGLFFYYKRIYRWNIALFTIWWHILLFVICAPIDVNKWFFSSLGLLLRPKRMFKSPFVEWAIWRFTGFFVEFSLAAIDLSMVGRKYTSSKGFRTQSNSRNFQSHFNQITMQFAIVISELGLPHYLRGGRKTDYSQNDIQDSMDLMSSLGWPINVSLADPDLSSSEVKKWKEWVIGGSDWQQGIANAKTHIDHNLDFMRVQGIELYKRSETYASIENEIAATSRYFRSPRYNYPDLSLNDVWFIIGDVFKESKLTPFNYIIKMWEKKFGLGAFMRQPGTNKKYKRKNFIRDIGGMASFKALWRRTFEYASLMVPVSAVSVKGEALPSRKWSHNKIRSVIGSPLGQYIMSTIWNYQPNHNFKWETTPIKVGMPLNGYHMIDVWSNHARCQHHYEGDMSDFDSTISDVVQGVVKAVRKRGFSNHKDRERLCDLIDINYDQVQYQVLNTTSNGNIYRKGTGLTTGHSSTSMDNSIATVTLYLMAWKELTGLSAKEFKFYNELSCYGDDHVLSFTSTKPASWSKTNIEKVMKKWGVINNMNQQPLDKIEFLSKFCKKTSAKDKEIFKSLGLSVPKMLVYHNRSKLLGKLLSDVKSFDPLYRARRLISYLGLTAHHPDIYAQIVHALKRSSTLKRALKGRSETIPSYRSVLKSWYSDKGHEPPPNDELENAIHSEERPGVFVQYGEVTMGDAIIGAIAMVPDLLNPMIYNFGYMKSFQLTLRRFLNWPIRLLVRQNGIFSEGELVRLVRSTAYDCLDPTLHVIDQDDTKIASDLFRHWIFITYKYFTWKASRTSFLERFARKLGSFQFGMNGYVQTNVTRTNLGLLDLLVIFLLSFIKIPDFDIMIDKIRLPDLNLWYEAVIQFFVVTIWSNVPPNYKEATHALNNLPLSGSPVLITAPTGTGKSTAFIQHVYLTQGHKYHRIIVVEPRSVLVKSLYQYMKANYFDDITGGTSGLDFDNRKKVIYCTPQFLFNKTELFSKDNLIVLDEAHLNEPVYQLLCNLTSHNNGNTIYLTATATKFLEDLSKITVSLDTAKIWQVSTKEIKDVEAVDIKTAERNYLNWVLSFCKQQWSSSKMLIFVPTVLIGERLQERLPKKSYFLHSKSGLPSDVSQYDIILSTCVADAGLTLPNIDTVITWDHDISIVDDGFEQRPTRVVLPNEVLKQRTGRTGRTNNGFCYIYRTPNVPKIFDDATVFASPAQIKNWLQNGVPPNLIGTLFDKQLVKTFNLYEGEDEYVTRQKSEEFARHLTLFLNNSMPLIQGRLKMLNEMEDITQFDPLDYTAAGSFSQKSQITNEDLYDKAIDGALLAFKIENDLDVNIKELSSVMDYLNNLPSTYTPFLALFNSVGFNDASEYIEAFKMDEFVPKLPKDVTNIPDISFFSGMKP